MPYNNISGMGRSIYHAGNDPDPLLDEEGIEIQEFYYDSTSGNLVLVFPSQKRAKTWELFFDNVKVIIHGSDDLNEQESHWMDIPIKASNDWNQFVDSLPKWDDP